MSRTIKSVFAAIAVFAALAPAAMADTGRHSSWRVSYADLDMSTDAGAKTLLGRIEIAARRVCTNVHRSQIGLRVIHSCSREAVATTVRQLDMPTLTLAWNGNPSANQLASR